MRRETILAVTMVALMALAGCSGGAPGSGGSGGSGSGSSGTGAMTVYLSDQPGSIGDFASLNATVTSVGFHRTGGNGTNATWVTENVTGTFDLTKLKGANASRITQLGLPNGTYDGVFVHVSNVNGTLTDGSHPDVKLPSSKLHLSTKFTVGSGEQSHFVYDVMVHKTGNGRYMIRPNAGGSGKGVSMRKTNASSGSHGAGGQSSHAWKNRSGKGNVVTYASDKPAAIDAFSHLNATVTSVGLHRVDANGSATANGSTSGWVSENVNATVDLTKLKGANASAISNQTVPNGTYDNVFVHISTVNGTLTDGTRVPVKLPSNKLHLSTKFTVGNGQTVHYVYDLAVHETGNGRYMIKPNAGQSGPNQPLTVVGSAGNVSVGAHGHAGGSAGENATASGNTTATADSGGNVSVSGNATGTGGTNATAAGSASASANASA